MTKEITIRKASASDLNEIVTIHRDAFNGFFLTSLGESFLKYYYSCFLKSNETVMMVALADGQVMGFSAATKVGKGFNNRMIKSNITTFGLLSLKMLLTEPKSLFHLVKNLTKKGDSVKDDEDYAELYSIGISRDAQGLGIGKKLLTATEQEMKVGGVKRVSLTTDYYGNDQAVGFYLSMGYETLYEFMTYPDRKMYRLIKEI